MVNTKLGVFIRSIGERTERLCIESVEKEAPGIDIHIIKNECPAYKAFEKMFSIALEHEYEWVFGLDADVVLVSGWHKWIMDKIAIDEESKSTIYNFSFPVNDYFFGKVDKGNHIFNGAYIKDALKILQAHTKHSGKPESTIKNYLPHLSSEFYHSEKCIGYHGYEQYFIDIFYRFYLQRIRNPGYGNEFSFLNKRFHDDLGLDYKVAILGWKHGRRLLPVRLWDRIKKRKVPISNAHKRSDFQNRLNRMSIVEKEQLNSTLDEFLLECHP